MAIKAGELAASAPGKTQTTISDGKRLRVMWNEGDSDGDPSPGLVERSINNMRGHPTWKVFCGELAVPLVRGKNEPPRHVYLDDRACYEVWSSQLYTRDELKFFWPFDFDNVGKIKTGRKNRGRPAYLDDSCSNYATGILRAKSKVYEFCGAPDFIGYTPDEASQADEDIELPPIIKSLITPIIPTLTFPLRPLGSTLTDSTNTHPSRFPQDIGNGRIPWEREESRDYIAGPADGSLLPLGMADKALQGSPYFERPTATYRLNPRPRSGDLAGIMSVLGRKRGRRDVARGDKVAEEEDVDVKPSDRFMKKRRTTRPFTNSASELTSPAKVTKVGDSPPAKILKVDEGSDELEPPYAAATTGYKK